MQWRELNNLLEDRHRLGKARTEQLMAYEKLRDQVLVWLQNTETRVNRLEPVAVDMEVIKRQIDELKVHKQIFISPLSFTLQPAPLFCPLIVFTVLM